MLLSSFIINYVCIFFNRFVIVKGYALVFPLYMRIFIKCFN